MVLSHKWGFHKIRVAFFEEGVPKVRIEVRIIIFRGLYYGPTRKGNYQKGGTHNTFAISILFWSLEPSKQVCLILGNPHIIEGQGTKSAVDPTVFVA